MLRDVAQVYILWMNLLVQIVGPFLVLTVLNVRIYKKIKEFEQTLLNDSSLRVCFTRNPTLVGRKYSQKG